MPPVPGPALLLVLAFGQSAPEDPLSPQDLDLMASLLAPTSTPTWAPPSLDGRSFSAARLTENLARSVDEALDLAPVPVFGPSGDTRLRTERLWGWFVEPAVGGWSELPPELFGRVVLSRAPILARADVESLHLEPWRDEDQVAQAWASARSADRSERGSARLALQGEAWNLQLAAFGEGGDGLLRVRRPTDPGAEDEDTDSRLFRELRAGGLGRFSIGSKQTRLEVLGGIDGREDKEPEPVGPGPFGAQDVVRHVVGVGLVHRGHHRAALRLSRQGASYRFPDQPRVDPVLYAWEADGELALGPWRLGLRHLGSAGRPFDGDVLRLEGGPSLGFAEGDWRLSLEVGGLLHELEQTQTRGWTGHAALTWGQDLQLGLELRKGLNGLAGLGRPAAIPDADQRSLRAAALLAWQSSRGGIRFRGGPLVLESQAEGAAVADLRLDGGLRLIGALSVHGALGWVSRFPSERRVEPGRADLLQDGIFVRSSLRWDPPVGVFEVHLAGRGASSGVDNDFLRLGGFAGLDFGRGFWLRVAVENALDAELPETFIGEPAGIDLSLAFGWEG